MIKFILVLIISPILLFNSLRIIDFINSKEKNPEDKINDTKLRRLIISTLTSILVVCLFLKTNSLIIFFKYFLLITYLMICAYIDQHTKNVYFILFVVFAIIGGMFFINGLFRGIGYFNYFISVIGTLIISVILAAPKYMGWGDVEVFFVTSLFLANLGFANLINIFLAFSLSGIGAIYYILRYKAKGEHRIALCPYILISTSIILILL